MKMDLKYVSLRIVSGYVYCNNIFVSFIFPRGIISCWLFTFYAIKKLISFKLHLREIFKVDYLSNAGFGVEKICSFFFTRSLHTDVISKSSRDTLHVANNILANFPLHRI